MDDKLSDDPPTMATRPPRVDDRVGSIAPIVPYEKTGNPSKARRKYNTKSVDKENASQAQGDKRKPPPTSQNAAPPLYGKRSKYDATASSTFYPIPLGPPMMRYTSSAAFSDISMPIHGLTSSKSFGPSGLFHGGPPPSSAVPPTLLRSTTTSATTASAASEWGPQAQDEYYAPSYPVGVAFSVDEINHHHHHHHHNTVGNPYNGHAHGHGHGHGSLGDLSMAASALLDLTPANHPPQIPSHGPGGRRLLLKHSQPFDSSAIQLPGMVGSYAHVQAYNTRLAERAQRLLYNVPLTFMACKCKNTKCLKLYCTCFQAGAYCDGKLCRCLGCSNTAEQSSPRGQRTHAIYEILSRRLDAFEPRLRKKTGHGCSCKKSRCLQKYCDCFANGSACTERCSCEDCSNDTSTKETDNPAEDDVLVTHDKNSLSTPLESV